MAAEKAAERIKQEFGGFVPSDMRRLHAKLDAGQPREALKRLFLTRNLPKNAPLAQAVTPLLLAVTADENLMTSEPRVRNAAFYTLVGLGKSAIWHHVPNGNATRTEIFGRARQLFGQISDDQGFRHAADAALAIVNDTTGPQSPFQTLADRIAGDQNAIGRSAIFKLVQQRDANAKKALRKADAVREKRIAAGPQLLRRL